MEDFTRRQCGPSRIVAALGHGGMAAVAFQPSINRDVALNILSRSLTTDSQFVSRFRHEAATLGQLQHPHILPVFDFGESDVDVYLAMPFIEGGTLASILEGRPSAVDGVERIIRQIGEAHRCDPCGPAGRPAVADANEQEADAGKYGLLAADLITAFDLELLPPGYVALTLVNALVLARTSTAEVAELASNLVAEGKPEYDQAAARLRTAYNL
jgi:hypothetical protein